MGVRGVSGLLIVGSTLLAAAPVVAQSRDEASRAEARKIGYAGVEAYQAGDFATARERLDTAYQLLQVPSLGLWSARALAKLGKLVEAEARYLEVIRLPTSVGDEVIQQQARQDAGNERAALARRIPSVVVRVEGAPTGEVAVTIDDAALVGSALGENHLVNPGRHQVEGIRGATRARAEISVAEGEQKEVVLRFVPGPAGASASAVPEAAVDVRPGAVSGGDGTMRTVGWVALGAGGAGIVAGAVAALIVRSKKNHLDEVGCGGSGQTCHVPRERGWQRRQLQQPSSRSRHQPDRGGSPRGRGNVSAADDPGALRDRRRRDSVGRSTPILARQHASRDRSRRDDRERGVLSARSGSRRHRRAPRGRVPLPTVRRRPGRRNGGSARAGKRW
jgi:hypothetical protein